MFFADFHVHSKYSRATSGDCVPEKLELWARRKGISLVGTGDFTHPAWREELKQKLVPAEDGLYLLNDSVRIRDEAPEQDSVTRFVVSGEISLIYKKNGRVRKVHNLILLPSLEYAQSIAGKLEVLGNLHSDGRPILGLDSRDLLQIVLDICPQAIFIPAHIWTPHFSLYGAYSGFDHIEECFGDLTDLIYALETGLSSNPPMNWRLSALDRFTLVSNSDAHSPANLGREANIFNCELSYSEILNALKNRNTDKFGGTIEFFPEEGKYHYDGHRACKVRLKPSETRSYGGICPVCGGRITVGVLHRVESLADREEGFVPEGKKRFESLVPLSELIASSIGSTSSSKKVKEKYENLIKSLGPELHVLLNASLDDVERVAGLLVSEGIRRLRSGNVKILPGYDGEYGKIKIFEKEELDMLSGQLCLTGFKALKAREGNKERKDKKRTGKSVVEPGEDPCLNTDGGRNKITCTAENNKEDIPYELNNEQWEAVFSRNRSILVVAGPGTGKTKTLVSRVLYLIEECGESPSGITAVTFTNKAADEMKRRLEKHFKSRRAVDDMTIGTFHSICVKILSEWGGNKSFNVIDEYDALAITERVVSGMGLSVSPKEALREISLIKSGGWKSAESRIDPDILKEVFESYCDKLKSMDAIDYDDILLKVLEMYEEGGKDKLPEDAGRRFLHLLVDEFQDINDIQYRLIKKWSEYSRSVFIIGDPNQSIYGFRGSEPYYFERFEKDFAGTDKHRLVLNYRSTPQIITAASSVISRGGKPFQNSCFPVAVRQDGAKIRFVKTPGEVSGAYYVAQEINRMVGGTDMLDAQNMSSVSGRKAVHEQIKGFSDIAVLYRTNRQADVLERSLIKEGVQYSVRGLDDFLAEKPVREAIAFFRLLLNPFDKLALMTITDLSVESARSITQKLAEKMSGRRGNSKTYLKAWEETQAELDDTGNLSELTRMLKKYVSHINRKKPVEIVESWIEDRGFKGVECMERLLNSSAMYDSMHSFLENIASGRESDVMLSGTKRFAPDAVSLMTIHASKGLEFPVVFIFGADEGVIPLEKKGTNTDLDEERRVFYVGVTRAMEELVIVSCGNPSRYISDMPEELINRETGFTHKRSGQFKQVSIFDD